MKAKITNIRLLPTVLLAGTVLLGLKGFGLVHEARAQDKPQQVASAVPADDGIRQPKDIADDDSQVASAAEVDVLSSLAKRRAELDTRTHELDMRQNVLSATEKRVDDKIAALKQMQAQITALLGQRDAAQEKQVASLVKTYSAMKPKDAARIFNGLNEDVLIPVAQDMKSDALAPILANMNAEAAQKLTVRLASRLAVPQTASLTPPGMNASASAGQQTASTQPAAPQAIAPQSAPAPQATAPQQAAPAPHG